MTTALSQREYWTRFIPLNDPGAFLHLKDALFVHTEALRMDESSIQVGLMSPITRERLLENFR